MFSTERLVLVQPTLADDDLIFRLRSDETVNKYIMRVRATHIDDARAFIARVLDNHAKDFSYYWTIRLKATNEMVGSICLWNISEDRKTAETGYDMLPEHFGKGYMSEAMQCIIDHGFNILQLDTIEAFTHYENERSRQLLERHGFIFQPDRKDEDVETNVVYSLVAVRE